MPRKDTITREDEPRTLLEESEEEDSDGAGSVDPPEDSQSTISIDGETRCTLEAKAFREEVPHHSDESLLQAVQDLEFVQDDISQVLIENNKLLRSAVDAVQRSNEKSQQVKIQNSTLKHQVSELQLELQQKTSDIKDLAKDKSKSASLLKIDQAAAVVKDLRDQLLQKDKQIDQLKTRVDEEMQAITDNRILRLQVTDTKRMMLDTESRCNGLNNRVTEQQLVIEAANEEIIKQQTIIEDYKSQLALLNCQISEIKKYYSMERHIRKQLQQKLHLTTTAIPASQIPTGERPTETGYGAALAASHSSDYAPVYPEYTDYRPY